MRQITLTLSEAPGDIASISYRCTIHSLCYQFAQYMDKDCHDQKTKKHFLLLGFVEFYFRFWIVAFWSLTICLLLVYFGSAAGCHCFDLQKSEFLEARQGWIRILHEDGVLDQVRTLSQVGTKNISKGGWAILELLSHVGTIT